MPYHYGASSSDVEWWPDSAEDGNQGDEDKTEEPKLQSSSPSSNDGWDYNVRYVAISLRMCLLSYYINIVQRECIRGRLWKPP